MNKLSLSGKYLFQRCFIRANKGQLRVALNSTPQKGGVVFDVGANYGIFSFWLALKLRRQGEIHIFEPQDELNWVYSFLGKLFPKVIFKVNNFGLSNTSKTMILHRNFIGHGGASLDRLDDKYNEITSKSVTLVSLDDYVASNSITKIDFIKIDVEGHEAKLIDGALGSIEKFLPKLLIEMNPSSIDCQNIIEKLENLGYKSEMLVGKKMIPAIKRNKYPHPVHGPTGSRDFYFSI